MLLWGRNYGTNNFHGLLSLLCKISAHQHPTHPLKAVIFLGSKDHMLKTLIACVHGLHSFLLFRNGENLFAKAFHQILLLFEAK